MPTYASSDPFQPLRKGNSKTNATDLTFEVSDSADSRASGAGKNRRKTKPTSRARGRHGVTNRPQNSAAVHREEARRAALKKSRGPAPKRGDVKATIFKGVVDATWGYLCASPMLTREVDAFLDSAPFHKKSEPMAKFWPLMDAPVLQE